jgi:2-polyprenyl-6-methoxyphenol hydroxylase-like FAD-dependent oxidoreductase
MKKQLARSATQVGEHAIVIGASISGLLLARVLSSYFTQVTLVERDQFLSRPQPRKGVPQGKHVHALLTKGATLLESLFPGLFASVVQDGSTVIDSGQDIHWFHAGYWKLQNKNGIELYCQSRPLLEWHVRKALASFPNVAFIDNCEVRGFCTNEQRTVITGVQLCKREAGAEEVSMKADLVIDASGRGSQTPNWLSALGYPQVEEETVRVDLGYASRLVKRTRVHPHGGKALIIYPIVPETKGAGYLFPVENDQWIITLAGWLKHHPPADEAGFLRYAQQLLQPDIYEEMKDAEPVTPIAIYKYPASRRLHYERMKRFPEGLLIAGDALCSFNPVYGQGMTVAALEAEVLDTYFRHHSHVDIHAPGFARSMHKRFFKLTRVPWLLATSEDLRYAQTEGKRMFGLPLLHWYIGRFFALTAVDPFICQCFYELLTMVKPLTIAAHPRVLWSVLFKKIPAKVLSANALSSLQPGEEKALVKARSFSSSSC